MDQTVNKEWKKRKTELEENLKQMIEDNKSDTDTLKVMLCLLKNSIVKQK